MGGVENVPPCVKLVDGDGRLEDDSVALVTRDEV